MYKVTGRYGKSTTDALHSVTTKVLHGLNDNKKVIVTLFDIQKAFDTVHFPTLFEKLTRCGLSINSVALLRSYLQDRTQCVRLKECLSESQNITHGVPQGSILGPLLFIIYLNEVYHLPFTGSIITYADDTCLISTGNDDAEVLAAAERDTQMLSNWMCANSFAINIKKTCFIYFQLRNNTHPEDITTIKIHNCNDALNCTCPEIKRVKSAKYLGVILDENLNFKLHVNYIAQKLKDNLPLTEA